jgi:hypothetical protein
LKRDLTSQEDTNSSLHLDELDQIPSKKSNTSQTVFKHGGPQFHCQSRYNMMLEHQKSQETKSRIPDYQENFFRKTRDALIQVILTLAIKIVIRLHA